MHGLNSKVELLTYLLLNPLEDIGVLILIEKLDCPVPSLANSDILERMPGPGTLDDLMLDSEIEQVTDIRNTLVEDNVKLRLAEGSRHLVLDHLDPRAVAAELVSILDRRDTAHIRSESEYPAELRDEVWIVV